MIVMKIRSNVYTRPSTELGTYYKMQLILELQDLPYTYLPEKCINRSLDIKVMRDLYSSLNNYDIH